MRYLHDSKTEKNAILRTRLNFMHNILRKYFNYMVFLNMSLHFCKYKSNKLDIFFYIYLLKLFMFT